MLKLVGRAYPDCSKLLKNALPAKPSPAEFPGLPGSGGKLEVHEASMETRTKNNTILPILIFIYLNF
jgi:hypothetical protein